MAGIERGGREENRKLEARYMLPVSHLPPFLIPAMQATRETVTGNLAFVCKTVPQAGFFKFEKKINANAFGKRLVRFFLFPSKTSKLPLYKPLAFTLYDFAFQSLLSTLSQAKEASDIDRET